MDPLYDALAEAYLAGFAASGEGFNGEYPFGDHHESPADDPIWRTDRACVVQALYDRLTEKEA